MRDITKHINNDKIHKKREKADKLLKKGGVK